MPDPLPPRFGPDTPWRHWLTTAPDPVYPVAKQASSEGNDDKAKGVVASMLRAIIRHKAGNDSSPSAKFVRLRPTLETADLVPRELCATLDEPLGDVWYHIREVTAGHTARAWDAYPVASEAEIETRYVCTYLPCMSALAETTPFYNLAADTATLHLTRQLPVPYIHYDDSRHTAYADAACRSKDGTVCGAPHEFKFDSRLTAAHFDALDDVGELTVVAREQSTPADGDEIPGGSRQDDTRPTTDSGASRDAPQHVQTAGKHSPTSPGTSPTESVAKVDIAAPQPPDILAQPQDRDRDKVRFFVATVAGNAEVHATLAGALAKLVEPASYAWAGPALYASIGNMGRWVATENAYENEPVVTWAKSLGKKRIAEGGGDKPEKQEWDDAKDDDEAFSLTSITYTPRDTPDSPASHFAFAAGKCFTHLAGIEEPSWPLGLDAVTPTPRKERRERLGLRGTEA